MEEIKKTRKIIPASEAKKTVKATVSKATESETVQPVQGNPSGQKSTGGLRAGAIILWVLAVLFEVATIYMLNIAQTTYAIIGIILDAVCCIAGSLLWKKANHINPTKTKNKFLAFLWNQMGVIACLVAFIPLGLFLLTKADKVSPQMKKVIAIIAAVAFLGSAAASVDYAPVTQEKLDQAQAQAQQVNSNFNGTVYWTQFGKSYHLSQDCQTLTRSEILYSGTLEEAFEAKRNDPCDFCAGGANQTPVLQAATGK